jgi:uncharacterized protein YjbI with pentapeptide repeats
VTVPEGPPISRDPVDHLAAASPEGRREWLLRRVDEAKDSKLDLSAGSVLDEIDLTGATISLQGADLRGVRLRRAKLARLDLRGADLRGASLGQADLRRAKLDEADLRDADLAGADLRGAHVEQADLRGALLEDAVLRSSIFRFAKLDGAAFEGADLRGADLWGATAPGIVAPGADLRRATLREADLREADLAGADLRGAALGQAALAGAKLRGADLRRSVPAGADFSGADLSDAKLQGLDLSGCRLAGARLRGAWLDKTRIGRDQLGEALGEELAGEFDAARLAYLGLERHFRVAGDPGAESWAYRRRRRMQKFDALRAGRAARLAGDTRAAIGGYGNYASDLIVEWVCDYGESITRILRTMVLVFVAFTILYGVAGSVVDTNTGQITRDPGDLAIFSLLAMTTPGNPPIGLAPRNVSVHIITGLQALLGVGLAGLLGFVTGNMVRR